MFRKRVFLAFYLNPAEPAVEKMKMVQKLLYDFQIRWVRKENFHVTLFVFGEMAVTQISDLRKLLRSTTRNFPPFKFSLEEPAIFKKGKVPRVLWLAIKSPDILLFESRLFPEGAQYLPIEVFPLSQSS